MNTFINMSMKKGQQGGSGGKSTCCTGLIMCAYECTCILACSHTNTLNKKISSIKSNKRINKPNRTTQVACASNPNTRQKGQLGLHSQTQTPNQKIYMDKHMMDKKQP